MTVSRRHVPLKKKDTRRALCQNTETLHTVPKFQTGMSTVLSLRAPRPSPRATRRACAQLLLSGTTLLTCWPYPLALSTACCTMAHAPFMVSTFSPFGPWYLTRGTMAMAICGWLVIGVHGALALISRSRPS